jgi:hypothetical protein
MGRFGVDVFHRTDHESRGCRGSGRPKIQTYSTGTGPCEERAAESRPAQISIWRSLPACFDPFFTHCNFASHLIYC